MTQLVPIQIRRDTAANWTTVNPTLLAGEMGVETDTKKIKVGDGATAWATLVYAADAGAAAAAAAAAAANALKAPTAWAASSSGGTPALTSGTAVLGSAFKNTTPGTTVFTTAIDGIPQSSQGDIFICLTAGTYTLLPSGGAFLGAFSSTGALPAFASNTGNFALVGTTFYFCTGAAWATIGGGSPTAAAWSTIFDTSLANGKDMGEFTQTAALALTSSDAGSVPDGYTVGVIVANGNAVTLDGVAQSTLTAGAHYKVELRRAGNSVFWSLGAVGGRAVQTPVAATITSAPVIAPASAGAAVNWTQGSVSGVPTPTVSYSLKKNGNVVSSPATSGSYSATTAGDILIVTQAATNAAYGGGTATPVSSAAVTVSSGVTPAIQQVATRAYTPQSMSTTYNSANSRAALYATEALTAIGVEFPGFYVAGTNSGNDSGTTGVNTWSASVEYPAGTYTPITWSGSTSATAANVVAGGAVATTGPSDLVTLPVTIPKGALFWINSNVNTPGNTGGGIPYNLSPTSQLFTAGGEMCEFSTGTLANKTLTGGITDSGTFSVIHPCAVFGMSVNSALAEIGDSRTYGVGSSSSIDANGNQGQIAPSCGTTIPYINMGVGGSYLYNFNLYGEQRRRLARLYCKTVISGYGINDLGAGAGDRSAAQLTADIQTFAKFFPGKTLVNSTISPGTVTGTYSSESTQTPDANAANWAATNSYINTIPSPWVAVMPVAESTIGLTVTNVWRANFTADGLHCNSNGYASILASVQPLIGPAMALAPAAQYSLLAVAYDKVYSIDVTNPALPRGSVNLNLVGARDIWNVSPNANNYGATVFNGGYGYTFNGTSTVLLGDAGILAATNGAPGFALALLFQIAAYPSSTRGFMGISGATSTNPRGVFTVTAAGLPGFNARRLDADTTVTAAGTTPLPLNTPILMVATFDPTNNAINLSINGVVVATAAYAAAGSFSPTNSGIAGIGAFGGAFSAMVMAEADVIVASVNAASRQKIEGDIAWRHGLASSLLPAGHPYLSAAPTSN